MDNYIIRDTEHFLFWEKEYKKDKNIFDDIVNILENRIEILQKKINYNTDSVLNMELNRELYLLESTLDRFIDQCDNIDEIMSDIDNMYCVSDDKINITEMIKRT